MCSQVQTLFKGVDFSMEKLDQLDREADAGRSRGAMARWVPAPDAHHPHCLHPTRSSAKHAKDDLFHTREKTENDPPPTMWLASFNILNVLEKLCH